MLANVSHELRSPLAVISAWAEMLSDGTLGTLEPDPSQAAENILVSAHHLTHLVNLLLTFQRLDREEMPMGAVSIPSLLAEAVASWQPILERDGVELEIQLEAEVDQVVGSADYLRQVLNNLLDNALKFSPEGGVTRLHAQRKGQWVRITVCDQGVGVEPEKLERLFERFYQADGGMTRRFEGMGLGLSLSQEIVRRHKGRIRADSEGEGKGLTVTIELPAYDGGPLPGGDLLPDLLG
jgi:signal transduction histidine kinase